MYYRLFLSFTWVDHIVWNLFHVLQKDGVSSVANMKRRQTRIRGVSFFLYFYTYVVTYDILYDQAPVKPKAVRPKAKVNCV